MTIEQILEKIKQQRGETALGDGGQLMGLFADYSGAQLKPQKNQLRIFLECQGNARILRLRNVPKQKQQVEWNRLIQEMVNDYRMQKEAAMEISGAFWRVAIGTEPPISNSTSEPRAESTISAPAAESKLHTTQEASGAYAINTAARAQIQENKAQASVHTTASPAKKQTFAVGKRIVQRFRNMTIFERITFLIGLFGVSVLSVHVFICVFTLLDGSFASYVGGANKAQVCLLFVYYLALLSGLVSLWKAGFNSGGLLGSKLVCLRMTLWAFGGLWIYFTGLMWVAQACPGVTAPRVWSLIYDYGGFACAVFGIIWSVRRFVTLRRIGFEERRRKRQAK